MRTCAALASIVASVLSVLVVALARAQDAQPPAKSEPRWPVRSVGPIAVSPDGKWLATRADFGNDGFRLYPTEGGTPVALKLGGLGSEELASDLCEFSADSKWLVIPGNHRNGSQSIFVFPTTPPVVRKSYRNDLVKPPKGSGDAREFVGGVAHPAPLAGSRMVFDRGPAGVQIWDVATGTKSAAPPGLAGPATCGISTDGTRCVRAAPGVLEVRDLAANQTIRTIALPAPAAPSTVERPVISPDGRRVLLVVRKDELGADLRWEFSAECWSLDEGKREWSTPLGRLGAIYELDVTASWAVLTTTPEKILVLDLRDGTRWKATDTFQRVHWARAAADGSCLWVSVTQETELVLQRLELPPSDRR